MKMNINLKTLLERMNKSEYLLKKWVDALKDKISKTNKQNCIKINNQMICNLLDWEYNDLLDYASLIFDDVCGQLCEYLKDRKQNTKPEYKKLYDMRNERWHCDDNKKFYNDFDYVKNIINDLISKPLSNAEIDHIKNEQIKFGKKLNIYNSNDDANTKLKKSYDIYKYIKEQTKK